MPPLRTPRDRWIEEGLKALASGGPDAVRVEAIAATLGVSKGGFYGHFDGRDALLAEILEMWERSTIDEVIDRVERGGGDARAKLARLFELPGSNEARTLMRAELAIRDWARRDRAVAKRLRRVDNRRLEYMRTLFREFCVDEDDVEVRCLLVMSLFTGTSFLVTDHGHLTRAEVVRLALARLLR